MTTSSTSVSSYAGIVEAVNTLRIQTGEKVRTYDASYQGIIDALLDLKKWTLAHASEFPPNYVVEINDQGELEGDFSPLPSNGDFWFDTRVGRLFVWMDDGFYQTNGADGVAAVGDTPPNQQVNGSFWYNSTTSALYINVAGSWTQISGASGFTTATLQLTNPTQAAFTGFGSTITPPSLTTQEDYNQWLITALQELETSLEATISAEPMLYGTSFPATANEGAFLLRTDENRLYVGYDGSWQPTTPDPDISTDPAITALESATDENATDIYYLDMSLATLQMAVYGNDQDIAALQAQPHHTYTLGTATATGQGDGFTPGIHLVDENGTSTGLNISGAGDVAIIEGANGITIGIAPAEARIQAIEDDYLTSSDKTSLESDITAIETTLSTYATVQSNISTLQADLAGRPTMADITPLVDSTGARMFNELNVQDNRIKNVATPIDAADAAPRSYVDARETAIRSDVLPVTGGTVGSLNILNSNSGSVGLDLSSSVNASTEVMKFRTNSPTGTHYTTFGTSSTPWEYSWKFNSDECFNYISGGVRSFAVKGNKTYAKDLVLCDLNADANGPVFSNQLDVRTKLAEIDALQTAVVALQADTHDPHVFYGDTSPTGTLTDGDLWFDSHNLRLNVRHGGYWIFPDRVEDVQLKTDLYNAVNTSTDYVSLRANLLSALS